MRTFDNYYNLFFHSKDPKLIDSIVPLPEIIGFWPLFTGMLLLFVQITLEFFGILIVDQMRSSAVFSIIFILFMIAFMLVMIFNFFLLLATVDYRLKFLKECPTEYFRISLIDHIVHTFYKSIGPYILIAGHFSNIFPAKRVEIMGSVFSYSVTKICYEIYYFYFKDSKQS